MKYKVQLQSVVTANVWVECSDEQEAVTIAESAWTLRLDGACIDSAVEAVYNYDANADDTHTVSVEQV